MPGDNDVAKYYLPCTEIRTESMVLLLGCHISVRNQEVSVILMGSETIGTDI